MTTEDRITELLNKVDLLLSEKNSLSKYTIFEWIDIFVSTYKVPKLTKKNGSETSGLKNIRDIIRLHIKPNIEDINLSLLTPIIIQEAISKIPYSRQKEAVYIFYNECLSKAYELDLIKKNIMIAVDAHKHVREKGKALTLEEQNKFLKSISKNKIKNLYRFYLLTGCRKSEALKIKFEHIDFNKKMITIPGTKTELSFRTIPLFPETEKIVLHQFEKFKSQSFVFPYKLSMVESNWKRLKNKENFNFRIHDLRHTFATRLLEKGVSLKLIQKWLGHSKLETTASIYMHVTDKFELEQIEKINFKI